MIARVLLLFALAISPLSAFAYFGPTVDTDEIGSSAQAGSGFFLQTVSATDHFAVRGNEDRSYLLNDNGEPQSLQPKLLNLAWMLGYAYYRSSGHDPASGNYTVDEAHAVKLGLAWETGGIFELKAAAAYEVMPAENYSQGIYDMSGDFIIPLSKERHVRVAGSSQDAAVYYENQELARQEMHSEPAERFPNLQIGLNVELQVHTKSPTTSGRLAGSTLTSDQTLNASAFGPELVLNPSPRVKFRLAAMFYLYDSAPDIFLSNTTIGGVRSKVDLSIADFEGTTAFLLFFPKRTVSASGTFWLNRAVDLNLLLAGATYDATGTTGPGLLTSTVSPGTVLDWAFAPRWKTGFALDYTFGNTGYGEAAGGAKLSFAL